MKCIIIEDQPPAHRILKKYIEDVPSLQLVGVFNDGLEALDYIYNHAVELIFLDIHLPKISGVQFLESLTHPPHIIFTTAYSEYALEGYNLNVLDYLLKPFSFQRFLQAIQKIPKNTNDYNHTATQAPKDIFIKSGHELIRVMVDDIYCISSDADYTELKLENNKLLSNEPLKYWLQALDSPHFSQVHKSHIVNTNKIVRIAGNMIYLGTTAKIPIGRAFKDSFMKNLMNNTGLKL